MLISRYTENHDLTKRQFLRVRGGGAGQKGEEPREGIEKMRKEKKEKEEEEEEETTASDST